MKPCIVCGGVDGNHYNTCPYDKGHVLEHMQLHTSFLAAQHAAELEAERRKNHHEIFRDAIRMYETTYTKGEISFVTLTTAISYARRIADIAYPPLKQCTLVGCEKPEPHDHPVSGPYCTPPEATKGSTK